MLEPSTYPPQSEGPKVEVVTTDYEDASCATFIIKDEDHTLGNALRYIIMKNPAVMFCGYSIPHPSECQINLRIQTDGQMTAVDALHKGLNDLQDLCNHVKTSFKKAVQAGKYTVDSGVEVTIE
ncbi:RNA polymerase subunit AC19 [Quaeritorhiza haematococci]|nr:RNA polymerase subunit AC19 [Quaeritorhiza haematococci]